MFQRGHLPTDPMARPKPEPNGAFTLVISSGVTSSGLTLTSVEYEEVLGGGIAISNTIDSGGQVTVLAGGQTMSDTVLSGGEEVISAGGFATLATVSAGGLVSGAGTLDGGDIQGFAVGLSVGPDASDYSVTESVASGGVTSALTVATYGNLTVYSGGLADATAVRAGGILEVDGSGAVASGATISGGGGLEDYGEADAVKILSGGVATVIGVASNTYTSASATSGLLSGATVYSGASLQIDSGGVGSSVVGSGGTIGVGFAGAVDTVTLRGGTLSADAGAIVSGLTLSGGAIATFGLQAQVEAVKIVSGTLVLAAQGADDGLALASGGALVDNGIAADGVLLSGFSSNSVLAGTITGAGLLANISGGLMQVTGATAGFTGEVVNFGGTIELAVSGAFAHASLDFDANTTSSSPYETYQIDKVDQPVSGGAFAAPLIDFSQNLERVDLAGVAYVSGATAKVKGDVLTLVDGAYTATFTLEHTRAQRYDVVSDGKGGIQIRPEGTSSPLAEAAAAFSPPGLTAGVLSAFEAGNPSLVLPLQPGASLDRHGS